MLILEMGMTACGNKDNSSSETTTSSIAEDSREEKTKLLKWTELSKLDTYKDFRAEFDKAFEIKIGGKHDKECF